MKNKGNAALQQNNIEEAIRYYGEAIECDKENHVLYSNRSAAYAKAEKYEEALTDADKAVALKSDWPKVRSIKQYTVLDLHCNKRPGHLRKFVLYH